MLSFTGRRNLFGTLAGTTVAADLTAADTLMNSADKKYLARSWHFLEKQDTLTTTASTQFKNLPQVVGKILSVYVTVGSQRHNPKPAPSRAFWDKLNSSRSTSDIPEYWYQYAGQIGLTPIPATTSNVITINHRRIVKDLSIADYATGNILTVTNGSTAVVGTGTSWTAAMAGRYLRITDSDTANKGDGQWYEIASVTDTTNLVLKAAYAGNSIAAGSAAYAIGQMAFYPDGFHELPVYDALSKWFKLKKDKKSADEFAHDAKELFALMSLEHSNKTDDPVIDDGGSSFINPNLTISL
jgi:hypothetical protein